MDQNIKLTTEYADSLPGQPPNIIEFGYGDSPFGTTLIAWANQHICRVAFCDQPTSDFENELRKFWPKTPIVKNNPGALDFAKQLFDKTSATRGFSLLVKGSQFQIKVWEALLQVKPGEVISYQALASLAGSPNASRAVGSAMAANKVAYLIPCHRVIRKNGDLGSYRWGRDKKAAMLQWEKRYDKGQHGGQVYL